MWSVLHWCDCQHMDRLHLQCSGCQNQQPNAFSGCTHCFFSHRQPSACEGNAHTIFPVTLLQGLAQSTDHCHRTGSRALLQSSCRHSAAGSVAHSNPHCALTCTVVSVRQQEKKQEKTGLHLCVNSMRSQVLYWAAQRKTGTKCHEPGYSVCISV